MLYGIGAKGLSEQLGVPEQEANSFMDMFKSKYPGMFDMLNRFEIIIIPRKFISVYCLCDC